MCLIMKASVLAVEFIYVTYSLSFFRQILAYSVYIPYIDTLRISFEGVFLFIIVLLSKSVNHL